MRRDRVSDTPPTETDEEDDEDPTRRQRKQHPSWISWFCTRYGNSFFCEIPLRFFENPISFDGLAGHVQPLKFTLPVVTGASPKVDRSISKDDIKSAVRLYGLVHARYILTTEGKAYVLEKYLKEITDTVPRLSANPNI